MYTPELGKRRLRWISNRIGLALLLFTLSGTVFSIIIQLCILLADQILPHIEGFGKTILLFFLSSEGINLLNIAGTILCEAAVVVFLAKTTKIKLRELFGKPYRGTAFVCKGALWFLSINVLVSIGFSYLSELFTALTGLTTTAPDLSTPSPDTPISMLLNIFLAVVSAPILEELLFRGFILRSLQRYGNVFAIVVSSVLFGLWHGNFAQSVPMICASMVLGMVAIRTNSLIPCIAVHAINNGLLTAFDLLGYALSPETSNLLYIGIMLAVGAAGFVVWMVNRKDAQVMDFNMSGLPASVRVGNFVAAPAILVTAAMIVLNFATTFVPSY